MTFYDYDYSVQPNGREVYSLRANCKPLPIGKCVVWREPDTDYWQRFTRWQSRHGTRRIVCANLDAALSSGIAWARRRDALRG